VVLKIRSVQITAQFIINVITISIKNLLNFIVVIQMSLNKLYQHLNSISTNLLEGRVRNIFDLEANIHFYIDYPRYIFKIIDKSFAVQGWVASINPEISVDVRIRINGRSYPAKPQKRDDVVSHLRPLGNISNEVGFTANPSLTMGLHWLTIDIHTTGSGWVRIHRNLLIKFFFKDQGRPKKAHTLSYVNWCRLDEKNSRTSLPEIKDHISVMRLHPRFILIIDLRFGSEGYPDTLRSIEKQIYSNFEIRTLNHSKEIFSSLSVVKIENHKGLFNSDSECFLLVIKPGQILSRNALYEFASSINCNSEAGLIYADEDYLNKFGNRTKPFYKPDWSPDYLETFNYFGFPMTFRIDLLPHSFCSITAYDLVLRLTEKEKNIVHIKKILGHSNHRKLSEEVRKNKVVQDLDAINLRLGRTGRKGIVTENQEHKGCYEIKLNMNQDKLVSVVIPTAGKKVSLNNKSIDLVLNVVEQIKTKSTYKNIEIIIVDNNDLSAEQLIFLTGYGCKMISYLEPILNIAKKLNLGASIARGELLLLMNDDIEVISEDFIERMLDHFQKPHVGVVGAKLLYPDGLTQHIGVVHNYGNPDHVRRFHSRNDAGYYFSTCGVHNFMAVTGAVMMTPAIIFQAVGGYTEKLAISYNDTDYCLKVREIGFYIVYTPLAELTHMESQSRIPSLDIEEWNWYQKRWASSFIEDPYYNEQFLTIQPPTFQPVINIQLL